MMINVKEVAYHRNGISGVPFYVVAFEDLSDKFPEPRQMIGVVFDGLGCVAVFDSDLLGVGVIAFGTNSWRGDRYEPQLRTAIAEHEKESGKLGCQPRIKLGASGNQSGAFFHAARSRRTEPCRT